MLHLRHLLQLWQHHTPVLQLWHLLLLQLLILLLLQRELESSMTNQKAGGQDSMGDLYSGMPDAAGVEDYKT